MITLFALKSKVAMYVIAGMLLFNTTTVDVLAQSGQQYRDEITNKILKTSKKCD